MAGYTPLFDSLTTGTLCGRWPDIGLWPIILSLKDKYGVVDVTPQYIAGVTGLKLEEVTACMKRFCEPDPYSRSGAEGGARLKLIDEHRDWGWIVVNHEKYREKARLMSKNEREVESGENQKRQKGKTAAHRRSPPETAAHHPSDADADADAEVRKDSRRAASGSGESPPDAPSIDQALFAEARAIFGPSIGGQINKAIRAKGKAFVVSVIEACRRKDPEAARAYFAAALNGQGNANADQRRRHPG